MKYLNPETGQVWDEETGEISDYDFSAGEMAKNIPGSAWDMAKNTATFLNPLNIMDKYRMGAGLKENPGAILDFYGDRYGNMNKAKRTLEQDPVGVMADVSTLTAPAGLMARLPGAAGKAASTVNKVGTGLDPLNAVINTGNLVNKAIPGGVPNSLMDSATKFTVNQSRTKADVDALNQSILDQDLPLSAKGVRKLNDDIDQLGVLIDDAIKDSTGSVPVDAVFKNMNQLRRDVGGVKMEAAKNKQVIDGYIKNFVEEMEAQGRSRITVQELQAFKQDLYQMANYDKKFGRVDPVLNQARKTVARGARELIEENVPQDIAALNRQQGGLLELREPFEKAVGRIERRNPLGIEPGIAAAGGGAIGDVPGALVGGIMGIADKPQNMSRLARYINRQQQSPITQLLSQGRLGTRIRQPIRELGEMYSDEEIQGLLAP